MSMWPYHETNDEDVQLKEKIERRENFIKNIAIMLSLLGFFVLAIIIMITVPFVYFCLHN